MMTRRYATCSHTRCCDSPNNAMTAAAGVIIVITFICTVLSETARPKQGVGLPATEMGGAGTDTHTSGRCPDIMIPPSPS